MHIRSAAWALLQAHRSSDGKRRPMSDGRWSPDPMSSTGWSWRAGKKAAGAKYVGGRGRGRGNGKNSNGKGKRGKGKGGQGKNGGGGNGSASNAHPVASEGLVPIDLLHESLEFGQHPRQFRFSVVGKPSYHGIKCGKCGQNWLFCELTSRQCPTCHEQFDEGCLNNRIKAQPAAEGEVDPLYTQFVKAGDFEEAAKACPPLSTKRRLPSWLRHKRPELLCYNK